MILRTGKFLASVISEDASFDLFRNFGFQSGRVVDKFADFTDVKRTGNGLYAVTKGTNAWISAKSFSQWTLDLIRSFLQRWRTPRFCQTAHLQPMLTIRIISSRSRKRQRQWDGDVGSVATFMKEKNCRLILSVRSVNMGRKISKKSDDHSVD